MVFIQSIAFCARKRRPAGGSAQEKSLTSASSMKQSDKTPAEKIPQQKSEDHVFCLPQTKVAEETTNLKSLDDDPKNPLLDPRVRARLMQPPKAPEKTQCPETANVADTIYNVDKQKMGQNDMAKNVPKEGVIEENKISKTSNPSPLQKCYIVSKMASLSRRKQNNDRGREHSPKITKAIIPQRKNDVDAPASGHELNVETSSSSGCPSPSVNMDPILVSHYMAPVAAELQLVLTSSKTGNAVKHFLTFQVKKCQTQSNA
ncbi:unnamed protein product [Cylicocyclus nassatus]|uniref:Uncharacterized protein n=1 Tax=Cylicocyclus nassatus TaxID=53992 RepID=A0AA36MD42_CYLNA|nr:unnamed protein product [Cylicocyclus nassatus]